MAKRDLQRTLKAWGWWAIQVTINSRLYKEGDDDCHGCDNSGNRCNYGADIDHSVSQESCFDTSTVYYNPSFACYLKAIGCLLKQALIHKKGVHFVLIGRMNDPT